MKLRTVATLGAGLIAVSAFTPSATAQTMDDGYTPTSESTFVDNSEFEVTNPSGTEIGAHQYSIQWAGPYNSSWQCWLAFPAFSRLGRVVDACSQHWDNGKWWIGVER